MDQIMGSCMSEEELDELYAKFKDSKTNAALYPHIKEKVASLYSIFKNDDNIERQRLAQWALTYFFDDEDIIHDDVSGLGLIDDMTVIDYAIIHSLRKNSLIGQTVLKIVIYIHTKIAI